MEKKYNNEFAKGLYVKENQQDWIIATLSINKKEFIEWLVNTDDEESIHIQIQTSKAGKMYAKKYNYKAITKSSETEEDRTQIQNKIDIIDDKNNSFWD